MRNYQRWNNILGWLVFAIATFVYVTTAERTTSWWDCGEYIATAFKLQVGHPPGAPTFQLLGSLFSQLAMGDLTKVGFMVNVMSALCSSFTILFLFWTITMLAKRLLMKMNNVTVDQFTLAHKVIIYGSAAVGALAYTFSDSFWFSAVEGEVYAMSSFFTAITFWAILKWESVADEPHNLRWIIFIAFLIGLAIGVHLLNLLVIPAVVYIIYYKKFKPSRKGFWYSALISGGLLAAILWGVVPWTVKLAGYFELFFVNSIGLPFNSGTIIYFLLLIGGLTYGIIYAIKKRKVLLHTILLCVVFVLIGYSTFFILVIRANAGVPINENEPKNALSLLSYLNREQYGTRPLLYGQYFNAPVVGRKETSSKYQRNDANGKYDVIGTNITYEYDPAYCGVFPRMHSSSESGGRPHVQYYKFWSGTKGDVKPTAAENMRFLFRYHFNWMYFRYFMWNFSGRQNNVQGLGYNEDGSRDIFNGNWISGIKFIDEMRLGPQDNLPDYLANNQARNTFYMLPLLLGLLGLWFQYKYHRRDSFVVFLLFFMTGLAIILYLNQPSTEPRERDYAYAGSFYAFAIWIGLGAMALFHFLSKKIPATVSASLAVGASLLFVPGLMAKEGWDDHDRSSRTAAYDFARNSLESCEPNAILIANGDNDTFPLWYCQEVEGIRTDVRIINSALAGSFWHVQPLFKKIYDSEPLKFTLSHEQYGESVNDYVLVDDKDFGESVELKSILNFIASNDPQTKRGYGNEKVSFIPTPRVKMTINTADLLARGIITEEQALRTPPVMEWTLGAKGSAIYKNDLCFIDVVGSNNWERPVYFMSSAAQGGVLPVPQYAETEGSVYRLVPYINENRVATGGRENGINTDKTYDLFVNKFTWGNLQNPKTAVDPESNSYTRATRFQYISLARALTFEGKKDSAIKVLDKSLEFFPHDKVPFDGLMLYQVEAYLQAGADEKGMKLANELFRIYEDRLLYCESFPRKYSNSLNGEMQECYGVFDGLRRILERYPNPQTDALAKKATAMLTQRGLIS